MNKYSILLINNYVEDSFLYNNWLVKNKNYSVSISKSLEEVFSSTLNSQHDLIVLDYFLPNFHPNFNIKEFIQKINELPNNNPTQESLIKNNPEILVILNEKNPSVIEELTQMQVKEYLIKNTLTEDLFCCTIKYLKREREMSKLLQQERNNYQVSLELSKKKEKCQNDILLINQIFKSIKNKISLPKIIDKILSESSKYFFCDRISYAELDENDNINFIKSFINNNLPSLEGKLWKKEHNYEYLQQLKNQPCFIVNNLQKEKHLSKILTSFLDVKTVSILHIPLRVNQKIYGILCICSSCEHKWKQKEVETIVEIADSLCFAIENNLNNQIIQNKKDNLKTIVKKRNEQLSKINQNYAIKQDNLLKQLQFSYLASEVNCILNQNESLKNTLQKCTDTITKYLDAALTRIWILNQDSQLLELKSSSGLYTHINGQHHKIKIGEFKVGKIAKSHQRLITNSVVGDAQIHDQEWAKREKLVSFAGYPMLFKNKLVGVIAAFFRYPLDLDTINNLNSIANWIALSVEKNKQEKDLHLANFALNQANDLVMIINNKGKFLYGNQALYKTLGYSKEEIREKHFFEITKRLNHKNWQEFFTEIKDNKFSKLETELSRKYDQEIPVEMIINCATIDNQEILSAIARDRSEFNATYTKLKITQDRLETVAHNVPGVIYEFLLNSQGKKSFSYMSNRCEKIWELTAEEITKNGDLLFDIVHPEDRESLERSIISSAETLQDWYWQGRIITPSNRLIWIEGKSRPKKQLDGAIIWHGMIMEITAKKENELEFQKNKQLKDAIFNESTDAIFLVNPQNLLTIDCNLKAVKLFCADNKKELLNININTFQKYQFTKQQLRSISQQIITRSFWEKELEYINFEGKTFWGNVTIKYINIANQKLNLIRITNISKRKKIEQALKESQIKYSSLVKASPVGIFRNNEYGECVYINRKCQEIIGIDLDTCKGIGWVDYIHPEDRNAVWSNWANAFTSKQMFEMEYRFLSPKGKVSWVLCQTIFEQNAQGKIIGSLGTLTDITDRKIFEQQLTKTAKKLKNSNRQLTHATQMKNEFIANVSHELRTPLNFILGVTKEFIDHNSERLSEEQKNDLFSIYHNSCYLLLLINDILDVAKIESGKLELILEEVSIKKLCDRSIDFIKKQAQQKNILINKKYKNIDYKITIDERRVVQILINLLSNAVKFTPNNGKITLEIITFVKEQKIVFNVIDTGIGISEEDLSKIFESFVQIDSKLSRQYKGTGLGLNLVKKLTELHGGRVFVKSKLNEGSCFSVVIPCSFSDEQKSDITIKKTEINSDYDKELIIVNQKNLPLLFVIENDHIFGETISNYLKAYNYTISILGKPESIISEISKNDYQLLLIDIDKENADFLDIIKSIRTLFDKTNKFIPIIVTTNDFNETDKRKYLNIGVNDYLDKKTRKSTLLAKIQNLTDS